MLKRSNTQKRNVVVCILVMLTGIFMIFAPTLYDISMTDGGGALILIGLFFALSGFTVSFIFGKRASVLGKMFKEEGILACWKFEGAQWQNYQEKEYAFRKERNRALLVLTGVICFIVGLVFLIADFKGGGPAVFLTLTGLMLVLSFAAWLMPKLYHIRNRNKAGETIISPEGVYLNGELHVWTGHGCRLDRVKFLRNDHLLEFRYYSPVRYGKQLNTIHVPVPDDKTYEATDVVRFFRSAAV